MHLPAIIFATAHPVAPAPVWISAHDSVCDICDVWQEEQVLRTYADEEYVEAFFCHAETLAGTLDNNPYVEEWIVEPVLVGIRVSGPNGLFYLDRKQAEAQIGWDAINRIEGHHIDVVNDAIDPVDFI
jgi:hypothetical protein